MKRLRSMLLTIAIILAIGLVFQPASVRAENRGPQNTSNSQSSGGSSPTLADVIRILMSIIW
jgi:hypothetical protein